MKSTLALLFISACFTAAAQDLKFTGVITDSKCGAKHQGANADQDRKCIQHCVEAGKSVAFILNDGKNSWKLSDRKTPAEFAGKHVSVTGTLDEKTSTIQVTKIEAAR
jgi:sugar/nucleoside kinase (ribokinase family)